MTEQQQAIIVMDSPNWIPIVSALIGAAAIVVAAWLGIRRKK